MEIIPRAPFTYPDFLAEVKKIEESGQFLDSLEEVKEGEEICGEMNDREKAWFTLINRLAKERSDKFLRYLDLKSRGVLSAREEGIGQFDLVVNETRTLLLQGALTLQVNDRIGWDNSGGVVGFRKGFKIVRPREEEEKPGILVKLGIMGIGR